MELATEIWQSTLQLMYQKTNLRNDHSESLKYVMAHFENQYESEIFAWLFFLYIFYLFFPHKNDKIYL